MAAPHRLHPGIPWRAGVFREVMTSDLDPGTPSDAPAETVSMAGERPTLTLALVVVCPLLVGGAVVAEVVAAQHANSDPVGWAAWFPLTWPVEARVAFWSVVAAAAAGFRWGLHRLGMRQRPLVVVATVAPFALFALGVATGSSFTTWH